MAKNKWRKKYKPELCRKLVEHMANGLSFESFVAIADCHRSVLYDWLEKYPEFKDAYESGMGKGRLYWETMGINGAAGTIKNFSAAVWIFTMKCRFGYRDGTETGPQAESKEEKSVIYKTTWRQIEKRAEKEIKNEK